jgi:phage-related protein|nr:MAG TPA: tail tape measure protein [Caudoviricetes sp.]
MAKNGGSVVFTFEADDSKVNSAMSGLGNGLKTAAGVGIAAVGALSAAITGVVTAGVNSYASLEQNIGGIETLFKDSADAVIANAKKAYETAGMSANQYMETITSFSARLLQGLGGDTEKAAKIADVAVQDMSDNANKMGTDINSIVQTYQSLARGNYEMLDNLKLGYGGTQSEMARLINDSGVLGDTMVATAENVNQISFDKFIEAIHVIQENMGITGTTALEAETTITGSMNAAKAAWDNFLNGTGDVETLSDALLTAFGNIGDAVSKLAPSITSGLVELFNGLVPQIPGMLQTLLPPILSGAAQIIQGLIAIAPQLFQMLLKLIQTSLTQLTAQMPVIIQQLVTGLTSIINQLSAMLPTLIPQLVAAIMAIIPALLENLPALIQTGIDLLIGLITGLINAIPVLIESLPQIISSLISGLMGAIPQLLAAGPKLVMGLIQGLINALPSLVTSGPKMVKAIVEGIANGISNIISAGKDLVKGLWQGISDSFTWIKNKIKSWVGNVLDFVKGLFGIHSPSTEFAYFGRMNVLGLEEGMEDMQDDLNATISDMVNLSPSLLASASSSYNPNVSVVVNNQFETDPLGQVVNRIKSVSGGARSDYNVGMGANA